MTKVVSITRLWSQELIEACEKGLTERVAQLLNRFPDVTAHAEEIIPALVAACQNGHVAVVNLLLDRGARVTMEVGVDRDWLWLTKSTEVAKLLLSKGGLRINDSDKETILFSEYVDRGMLRSGQLYLGPEATLSAIRRCDELNLAVIGVDGFEFRGEARGPRLDMICEPRCSRERTWKDFRGCCNRSSLESIAMEPWLDCLKFEFVLWSEKEWLAPRRTRRGNDCGSEGPNDELSLAQDDQTELNEVRVLTEPEDVQAESLQAWAYFHGDGVEQDYEKASQCFLKSAEQDDAVAQWLTGLFFGNGLGVPRDYREAEKWLLKSAGQNFPRALRVLADLYERGTWVAQSSGKAAACRRRALRLTGRELSDK